MAFPMALFDMAAAVLLGLTALLGEKHTNPGSISPFLLRSSSRPFPEYRFILLCECQAGAYTPVLLSRRGAGSTGDRSMSYVMGNMLSAGGTPSLC